MDTTPLDTATFIAAQDKITLGELSLLTGLEIDVVSSAPEGLVHVQISFQGIDNFLETAMQVNHITFNDDQDPAMVIAIALSRIAGHQAKRRAATLTVDPFLGNLIADAGLSARELATYLKSSGKVDRSSEHSIEISADLGGKDLAIIANNGKLTVAYTIDNMLSWAHNALTIRGGHFADAVNKLTNRPINEVLDHPLVAKVLAAKPVKVAVLRGETTTLYV